MRTKHLISVTVLLLAGLATSCVRAPTIRVDSQKASEQVSPVKLAEIGKIMHVTFPDGTKVLGLLEEPGGIDRAIHLKVEFAAKDLEDFVQKSPFVDSKFSTTGRLV